MRLSLSVIASAMACGIAAAQPVQAVLKAEPLTLTTAAPDATGTKYPAQPVAMDFKHRGVFLDGTMRAPWLLDCQFASNTTDPAAFPETTLTDVRLFTGQYAPTEIDLALPCYGPRWVIGRTRTPIRTVAGAVHGRGWFQASQPEFAYFNRPSTDSDSIYILYGGDRYAEFQRVQDAQGVWTSTFRGVNGTAGAVTTSNEVVTSFGRAAASSSSSILLITYHDPLGNTVTFFEGSGVGNVAKYQIWKISDAEGNLAYVGHPTSISLALANGYDSSGRIKLAFDAAGRQFTYSYGGAPSRLQSVSVAASSTDPTIVATVSYTYYAADGDAGGVGDLKAVTTSTPVSGGTIDATTYYRYWTATSAALSDESKGPAGSVRFVVGPEGVRRCPSYGTASDSALVPYADVRLSYESTSLGARVSKVQSDGLTTRWRTISYGTNPITQTPGYDQGWTTRAVVADVDAGNGNAVVRAGVFYFDEVGQPLSSVTLPSVPSGSPTSNAWCAKVDRDSGGRVVLVGTPASVEAYTHSTGTFDPAGGGGGSVGLTSRITRISSGNLVGFASSVGHSMGWTGAITADSGMGYRASDGSQFPLKSIANYTILRPLVDSHTRYPVAGGAGETTTTYHNTPTVAATSDLALTIDWVYVFEPVVPTAMHGSGLSTGSAVSFTPGGLPRFVRDRGDQHGQLTEITYDTVSFGGTGQIRTVTIDPTTTPPAGFPSGAAMPHPRTTTYHYDAQGRLTQTDDIDGSLQHHLVYSRLADGRPVSVSASRLTPGGAFASPASFSVTNLNGASEAEGLLAVVPPGSGLSFGDVHSDPTHPGTLVNTATSDPLQILSSSAWRVRSPSLTFYGSDGRRPTSKIVYHTLGTSPGFDSTLISYDSMGRVRRVTDPTGTFNQMAYDVLGRVTQVFRDVNAMDPNPQIIASYVYDGGGIGNSNLTQVTRHTGYTGSPDRTASYMHDEMGRVKAVVNPESPHVYVKRDNLGRPTATGFYGGSPSSFASLVSSNPGLDPLTPHATRLGYRERRFDPLGQLYKQLDAMGSGQAGFDCTTSILPTDYWYDPQGRLAMEHGRQTVKKTYDSSGSCGCQATSTYQCAVTCDPETLPYQDAVSVQASGGCQTVVLAETHEILDDSRRYSTMTVTAERNPDGTHGGPLMSTGCSLAFENANARVSAVLHRRDGLHRPIATADYGRMRGPTPTTLDCGNAASVSPGSIIPHEVRATFYEFDEAGRLRHQSDERGGGSFKTYDEMGRPLTIQSALFDFDSNSCQPKIEEYTYTKGRPETLCASTTGCEIEKTVRYEYPDGAQMSDYPPLLMMVPLNDNNKPTTITYDDGTAFPDKRLWMASDALGEQVMYVDQAGILGQAQMTASGRLATLNFGPLLSADPINGLPAFELPVSHINYTYDQWGRLTGAEQFAPGNLSLGSTSWGLTNWGDVSSFRQDFRLQTNGGAIYDPVGGATWDDFRDSLRTDYRWSFVDGSGGAPGTCGGGEAGWWRGPRLDRAWMPGTSRVGGGGLPALADFEYKRDQAMGLGADPIDLDKWTGRVSGVSLPSLPDTIKPWVRYGYWGIIKPSEVVLTRPQQDKLIYSPYIYSPYLGGTTQLAMAIIPGPQDDDREGINPWGEPTTDRWNRFICAGGGPGSECDPEYITPEWSKPADVDSRVTELPCACGIIKLDVTDPRRNERHDLTCAGIAKDTVGPDAIIPGNPLTPGLLTRVDTWGHDPNGNWTNHTRDLFTFNGTTSQPPAINEFNRTRTFSTRGDQPLSETQTGQTSHTSTILHDQRGNLRDDGTYVYQYDHANHLVAVYLSAQSPTSHGSLVARYGYDALGRRTSAQYPGLAGDVGWAPSYLFAYDDAWRVSAVVELSAALGSGAGAPVRLTRYLYHAAGFGDGVGGTTSGDAPFARILFNWSPSGPGGQGSWTKVDEQHFLTSKDGDVAAVVEPGSGGNPGRLIARVRYTAFGEPSFIEPADFDGDGEVTEDDETLFLLTASNFASLAPGNDPQEGNTQGWTNLLDFDGDGVLEIAAPTVDDLVAFADEHSQRLEHNVGEELAGAAGLPLYRGYWFDPVLSSATSGGRAIYHVRHRVYDASRGRWIQRDPIGLAGGINLYQYVGNQPDGNTDPDGLIVRQVLAAAIKLLDPMGVVFDDPMEAAEEGLRYVAGDDFVEGDKAYDESSFGDGGVAEDAKHEQATKRPIAKCYEMVKDERKKGNKKKAEDLKCVCDKWAAESYLDAQKVAGARYEQAERSAQLSKAVIVAVATMGAGSSLAGGAAYFAGIEGLIELTTNPNASPQDILRAMAWGTLDGAMGWGVSKGLTYVLSRTAGATMDFLAGEARLGGQAYGKARLAKLGKYLEARGVTLKLDSEDLFRYRAHGIFNPRTRQLHLWSNATRYEVSHELSHYLDWKRLGPATYRRLGRTAGWNEAEHLVYDRLRSSRRWNDLTPAERHDAILYLLRKGGFPW